MTRLEARVEYDAEQNCWYAYCPVEGCTNRRRGKTKREATGRFHRHLTFHKPERIVVQQGDDTVE